jgi:pimeloyl-ACP methyl ester carboxylesterase
MPDSDHPTVPGVDVDHRTVEAAGVDLHVAVAGPEGGEPVLLMHGFPDFWYGWRHQIPALADAGYRVWVPDQRGYNTSDKPGGVESYSLDRLGADALAVADAAGDGEVHFVAHDWGAVVAWYLGTQYPERVDRLVPINVPHPTVFRRHLRRDPRQMLRSWYALYFQLPWLPERTFSALNHRVGVAATKEFAREGAFTDADLAHYRTAWSRPGALTAMLNWYRAFLRHPVALPEPHVAPPTALLWGVEDDALREEMAPESVELCEDGRLVRFSGATHWVHREVPEMVNDLIVRFLGGDDLR